MTTKNTFTTAAISKRRRQARPPRERAASVAAEESHITEETAVFAAVLFCEEAQSHRVKAYAPSLIKEKIHSAIILITHDLGIISDICDSVIVMYAGRIVEKGSIDDFGEIDTYLKKNGCEAAILACTELSCFKNYHALDRFYLDALDVLCEESVRLCGGKLKEEFDFQKS